MKKLLLLAPVMGIWAIALSSVGEAWSASPQGLQYHHASLNARLPPGFEQFIPVKITDSGRVYGNLVPKGCSGFCVLTTGVHQSSKTAVIRKDLFLHTANESGTLGGSVITDPLNGFEQAALVEGGRFKLLPRLKGEVSSFVQLVTDLGLARVKSFQGEETGFRLDYYYYWNGQTILLPVLSNVDVQALSNLGLIAGTKFGPNYPYDLRAIQFVPPSGTRIYTPIPPYASSWAFGINNLGDVFGYMDALSPSSDARTQRIGRWRGQNFLTYFIQGTTEFPERSQSLVSNEQGLIVASPDFVFGTSFVLPWPGLRIALPDITDETAFQLWFAVDVNSRGDIVGFGISHDDFVSDDVLLQRVAGDKGRAGRAASSAGGSLAASAQRLLQDFPRDQPIPRATMCAVLGHGRIADTGLPTQWPPVFALAAGGGKPITALAAEAPVPAKSTS